MNLKKFVRYQAICLLLLLKTSLFGQIQKDTITLSDLPIQTSPIQTTIQNTASAVAIVSQNDLTKNNGVILTPILNTIPGLYMQQGALNTNRITIRGIGARTPYGTNKVKAYFDDIPL